MWQAGEVLQVNELGYRDVEARLPMQRDTMFRIASMTKPVTVAAAMTLVDEGRLALTDPVAKWLPELSELRVMTDIRGSLDDTVPAERPITFDDLMTHRSGFAYAFSVPGPLARAYGKLSHRQDQDGWLADLAEASVGASARCATDLRRVDRCARYRTVADRGQAACRGSVRAHLRTARHARHRVQRRPDRTAASGDDVPTREDDTLRHDSMGPAPITDPPLCSGGAGCGRRSTTICGSRGCCSAGGTLDGVRVLSEESAHLMRTDRLTDEQRRYPFLGMPYWVGRGFGLNLSVVTDPAKSRQLFGPGGKGTFTWPGAYGTWWQADPSADLILLYLIQNHPDLSADCRRGRGQHVAGETARRATEVRPADVPSAEYLMTHMSPRVVGKPLGLAVTRLESTSRPS